MPVLPLSIIPHSRPTPVLGMAEAIAKVLDSGQHAGGGGRQQFEAALCQRLDSSFAFAVQTGSAAGHLALLALETGPGCRVLLPTYTCMAVLNSVTACGAEPVLVDADPLTANIGLQQIEQALTREGLKPSDVHCAIIPHMMGVPAFEISKICDTYSFPVIEDCAMAIGAEVAGQQVGGAGTLSIFSFYATKMLSTGHGGAVVTSCENISARLKDLLQYDGRESYRETTWNYRMSDIAASMGQMQLAQLDDFVARRRRLAEQFASRCQALGIRYHRSTQEEDVPCWFRFTLLLAKRKNIQERLAGLAIEAKPPVFRPLHHYLQQDPRHFVGAEQMWQQALSLPFYPSLSEAEIERLLSALDSCR